MSKVYLDDTTLTGIANQTRRLTDTEDTYTPSGMITALSTVETGITPTGTINITQNGTTDVTNYASANVSVSTEPDWTQYFRNALEGGTSANNAKTKFVKLFIKFPFKFIPTGNSLDYCFRDFSYLDETPDIDMTNITSMVYTFDSCIRLNTIRQYDTSNVTNMESVCHNTNISSFPLLNTSKVTNMSKMLGTCSRLTTVPVLNTSSVTDMTNMFQNDLALTTDSLDNILQMCINATSYTGTKTLATLGISNVNYYPIATIQALPHYSDFVSAGWSIGY